MVIKLMNNKGNVTHFEEQSESHSVIECTLSTVLRRAEGLNTGARWLGTRLRTRPD